MEAKVGIAPFVGHKNVLVVFGCVILVIFIKVDQRGLFRVNFEF